MIEWNNLPSRWITPPPWWEELKVHIRRPSLFTWPPITPPDSHFWKQQKTLNCAFLFTVPEAASPPMWNGYLWIAESHQLLRWVVRLNDLQLLVQIWEPLCSTASFHTSKKHHNLFTMDATKPTSNSSNDSRKSEPQATHPTITRRQRVISDCVKVELPNPHTMWFRSDREVKRPIMTVGGEDNQTISHHIEYKWTDRTLQSHYWGKTVVQFLRRRIASNLVEEKQDGVEKISNKWKAVEEVYTNLAATRDVVECTAANEASPPGQTCVHLKCLLLKHGKLDSVIRLLILQVDSNTAWQSASISSSRPVNRFGYSNASARSGMSWIRQLTCLSFSDCINFSWHPIKHAPVFTIRTSPSAALTCAFTCRIATCGEFGTNFHLMKEVFLFSLRGGWFGSRGICSWANWIITYQLSDIPICKYIGTVWSGIKWKVFVALSQFLLSPRPPVFERWRLIIHQTLANSFAFISNNFASIHANMPWIRHKL